CEPEALRRAEAAARPALSTRLAAGHSTEGEDTFALYLRGVLARLPEPPEPEAAAALAAALTPVLRVPGRADRLWSRLLPGVRGALDAFRTMGLRLVVVSNADGSVERGLRAAGVRAFFDAVVDSAHVGFEKPDPRIFTHALRGVGAEASRTLHVGDLYHADVEGARAAGLHALLLDPWNDWPEPDCERLPDLAALAARLRKARR
ncbi:MAG: HAD-IA family hydrolase, partial [Myxococcota bacterium]|nr:HAD-IA family hydrolase [Myxococcota bacterium]